MDESGIVSMRARALDRFIDFARHLLRDDDALSSVMLMCAECWNDEATDAVQESVIASRDVIPRGNSETVSWDVINDRLAWNANVDAVWAFSAMCTEEGYVEETGTVDPELKEIYRATYSPLVIAQRHGDRMRVTWLGRLHRGWLDFPSAELRERSYPYPLHAPGSEPPAPPLIGIERELYDQVLAGDDGARDVLRDVWTVRGDPRGEFCALTSGPGPRPQRAADLVAHHGRSWVGALQPVIPLSGALFGYGPFIARAIVYAPDRATFERVADAPEWGTIEAITFAEGSYRALSPRMHRLRAVGPLDADQLPMLAGHPIDDLEIEIGRGALARLAELDLPLRVLRLRATHLDPLEPLKTARWWATLGRLEIWLPAGTADAAREIVRMFDAVADQLPEEITLAVGMLDCGVRSGWVLAGNARDRRLELVRPDRHEDVANLLSIVTGLPRRPKFLADDHWLTLAIGVASDHPL